MADLLHVGCCNPVDHVLELATQAGWEFHMQASWECQTQTDWVFDVQAG